jgi:putative peptidoglycan lipid II flippase
MPTDSEAAEPDSTNGEHIEATPTAAQPAASVPQRSVGRSSAIIASGTLVSRLLGFVSGMVLAQTIGLVGTGANTFALANSLPNNIAIIVAAGLFNAVFVPAIVRATLHDDGGARFINRLVTLGISIFIVIGIISTFAAPLLVSLYGQLDAESGRGFSDADLALATAFAYWCLPQVLFYALYSLLGEVLNARGVFGPFSWAPAINNLVAIAGLIAFGLIFGPTAGQTDAAHWTDGMIALLAGSATLGVAVQAFSLCFFWRRAGLRYRPDFHWRGVGLSSTGKAAAWTFSMIVVIQLAGIVQSKMTSLAVEPGGGDNAAYAVLRYAWLIFMLPHSIVAIPITTAYFTRMSAAARDGRLDKVRDDLRSSLLSIGFVIVFSSIGLMVLAVPFSALFAQTADEAFQMALVLVAFLIGLLPLSVHYVLRRVFYSMEDTRTPFFITLFQSTLFVITVMLVWLLPSNLVAVGIASITTFTATAQAILAFALARRKLGLSIGGRLLIRRHAVFIAATIPAAALGLAVVNALGSFDPNGFAVAGRLEAIITLIAGGSVMAAAYLGTLLAVRNPEATAIVRPIVRRVFNRR